MKFAKEAKKCIVVKFIKFIKGCIMMIKQIKISKELIKNKLFMVKFNFI